MKYYFSKKLNVPFDKAIELVTTELSKYGFGILTEIDVRNTLKKKLNMDFSRYVILGACNPPIAYRALKAESKIGTMLPCNVIIQEHGENDVEVSAINPITSMQAIDNPELGKIAAEVQQRLKEVIDHL